ncbi:MAG: SDR family oxidoreductase [Anaerolineales bacterium]|nr:SDR family oxidoreductase [Anaerolineales bacterium]
MDFHAKNVFITGGSSGIGLALAQEFTRLGARLFLVARDPGKLEAAVNQLSGLGPGPITALPADVSSPEQAKQAVETALQRAGVIDILINSAGNVIPGYVQDIPVEAYRELIETNYLGTVYITKAALPGMMARRSGHIINISSGAGFVGFMGYTAYSPTKYAVRGFTDCLRNELKPYGIQVAIVYPPDTDTPQLAYDIQHRPVEINYAMPVSVQKPESVARAILRGIERKQRVIIPDLGTRLFYNLFSFLGDYTFNVIDWLLESGRKKAIKAGKIPQDK